VNGQGYDGIFKRVQGDQPPIFVIGEAKNRNGGILMNPPTNSDTVTNAILKKYFKEANGQFEFNEIEFGDEIAKLVDADKDALELAAQQGRLEIQIFAGGAKNILDPQLPKQVVIQTTGQLIKVIYILNGVRQP
jgi:hypothetical protein